MLCFNKLGNKYLKITISFCFAESVESCLLSFVQRPSLGLWCPGKVLQHYDFWSSRPALHFSDGELTLKRQLTSFHFNHGGCIIQLSTWILSWQFSASLNSQSDADVTTSQSLCPVNIVIPEKQVISITTVNIHLLSSRFTTSAYNTASATATLSEFLS